MLKEDKQWDEILEKYEKSEDDPKRYFVSFDCNNLVTDTTVIDPFG